MNESNLDNTCLDTQEAKNLISYMEDFHSEITKHLRDSKGFNSFIFPFVELLLYNIKNYKSSGFNSSDANMESYKDTCHLLDVGIEEYKINIMPMK